MTWRRIPARCTETIDVEGHMLDGQQCEGLAAWHDGEGEARCVMHGPAAELEDG